MKTMEDYIRLFDEQKWGALAVLARDYEDGGGTHLEFYNAVHKKLWALAEMRNMIPEDDEDEEDDCGQE